jgi:DNA-binding SARP family transcriptional activator
LRCALEPGDTRKGTYLITTSLGEVGFNRDSEHWLDVAVFEDETAPITRKPIEIMEGHEAANLEKALDLYIGDFLEGSYEDWALCERERLRALYLKGLAHLMEYHRHHREYEKAIRCGQEILKHDPLREEVHRTIMRIYWESGQRALAIRQYRTCCQMLVAELDVPPMEETETLHAQILNATCFYPKKANFRQGDGEPGPERRNTTSSTEPEVLESAYRKLQLGMQHFEKTKDHFHRAVLLLEQVIRRS